MASARRNRVEQVSAAVAFAAAAFACSLPAKSIDDSSRRAISTRLRDDSGKSMLGAPCVTQAIETCFDARDDNCNGLFDEGCGLPDGALQLMIAWDEPFADVDLEVFDPRGEPSLVGQRSTLGLTKDRDCPTESDECGGQNVEVVTLDGDTLPLGRYLVTVRLERAGQSAEPVSLRLGGHIGNEPIVGSYELSLAAPEIHLEFERRLAPGKDKSSGM